MKVVDRWKQSLRTDQSWKNLGSMLSRAGRALPRASAEYVIEKVPISGWIFHYNPRWLPNDVIAGLTLGIMLVPQSLAYAKIATIPVQFGLMSSWFPATLYAFMGTTKDLSTGPTSLIGLLTAEVVADLTKEGYSPQAVASAVAMGMGIYGMILGFLKLGFLLDFVSTPILNGFISAAALVISLGQVDSLLGENNVNDPTGTTIHDIFAQLPFANGYACGMGFGSIVILVALEQAGKRWGSKNKVIFYLSIMRAFICLLLFTGISYAVNHKRGPDPDNYLFEVAEVVKTEIYPEATDSKLFAKAFPRAIPPFVAAALEHVAIARAFGQRNNYVTDTSQELCYLGLTNFVNSFFHSMGVGGAMSRTAVNSSCKVRSPLSGFVTTAVVLISVYELSGALYWIPKATLAAIVITAVYPLIGSWRTYYHYWRTSFTDFLASMTAFWVTLFVASEYGIGASVGFMIVQYLLRKAFAKVRPSGTDASPELHRDITAAQGMPAVIPPDTRIFKFMTDIFYPNAQRMKQQVMDTIQTYHSAQHSSIYGDEKERNWSVVGAKRLIKLRKTAGVLDTSLPPIRLAILDFTKVSHIDVTSNLKLREFFNELKKYAGNDVEVRFVNLEPHIRARLERARPGWELLDAESGPAEGNAENDKGEKPVRVFDSVNEAILAGRVSEVSSIMAEKAAVDHRENEVNSSNEKV